MTYQVPGWRITAAFLLVVAMSVWGLASLNDANDIAKRAIASADARGGRASKRISQLLAKINDLEAMLRFAQAQGAAERAALETKIDALIAQVESLGGEPVARNSPRSPTSSTTSTSVPCPVDLLGRCLLKGN